MKTTTNVQKTNLKSVIFAAGLIVIGFSVDGQGATKPDLTIDNNKHFAFASARMLPATTASKVTATTASFSAFTAPATEEALTLENWMTNESRFDGTEALFEPAVEEALTLESWMTDEKNFTVSQKKPKTEKTVVFEIYTSKFMYREVNFEEELKIEPWMIDPQVWR
ncbi:MAG: hypothetical protein AB7S72_01430 [Draconibacterium sp.]